MIEGQGNIWDHHAQGLWIVVSTNIGWRRDGSNVMGAGIARAAADMYPNLPEWYGDVCQDKGSRTKVCAYESGRLFLFPVKPLKLATPWLSWQANADLDLIEKSAVELQELRDKILDPGEEVGVPLVGCNNGGLDPADVIPILESSLDDTFVLYRYY